MLPHRLKEARLRAGLSQQKLGVLAGIDEATASARMNQYERGVHTPDFALACKLAEVLNVPVSYFYTPEDDLAEIILNYRPVKNTESKKPSCYFLKNSYVDLYLPLKE